MRNTPNAHKRIHIGNRRPFALSVATSLAALAIATISLVVIGSDTAFAGSFNPYGGASLSDPTPGANANISTEFNLDAPDYNFGGLVSFTPREFAVTKGSDIPDGEGVLFLKALVTLGVINGPCQPSGLTAEFQMMDATTNTGGPTVTFGDDPTDPGDKGEIFEDDDTDGLPNGVEMYPDFLLRIFPGMQPWARLYGQTEVVGNDVALNFVMFEPGTDFPRVGQPPFETDEALGYPSVTILQNLGDPEAEPNASTITDFCSPLATTMTTCGVTQNKGAMNRDNPCPGGGPGTPARTNPGSDMTLNLVTAAVSQPDADGDNIENGMDTCPYDDNLENPRLPSADPPNIYDGIDSACDPAPDKLCYPDAAPTSADCDGDSFLNRGDNCPLVWNGDDLDTPNVIEGQENGDGDGIGDVCDENPNTIDGERLVKCVVMPVDIGAGGTPPPSPDICTVNRIGFTSPPVAQATPTPTPGPGATPTPTPAPDVTVEKTVAAGETLTTAEEGAGATADDPVVVAVTSPNAGDVKIVVKAETDVAPPEGFQFLGSQVDITAPDATPEDPLVLVFQLDSSIIPPGEDQNTIQVFKDGVPVAACSDDSGTASPDPCVSDRALLGDGDVQLTVLTSTASSWNFGIKTTAVAGAGDAGGTGGAAGGADTGVGSLAPIASSIPAWAAIMSALGGAGLLGSLGAIASRILRRRR